SFIAAAGLCGMAILLAARATEPGVEHHAGGAKVALIHRKALAPGSVLALAVAGTTAFNAYIPLYVHELNMSGPQFVFLEYAAVVLSVRVGLARLPDRWGPMRTGTAATACVCIGFLLLAGLRSVAGLYTGTAVIALGNSLI